MTFWELAQSWPHDMTMKKVQVVPDGWDDDGLKYREEVLEPSVDATWCRRCQFEQLLREKAKEADAIDPYPFKNQTAREISKDFSIALKEMLGVPEGK